MLALLIIFGGLKFSCVEKLQSATSAAGQTCSVPLKSPITKQMQLEVKRSDGVNTYWNVNPGDKEVKFYEGIGLKFKIKLIERK